MKNITYTAPAKVILSGEHAVVYGKPALVSALDLRLKFSICESNKNTKNETIVFISDKVKEYLGKKKIKFKDKNFSVKIESSIPIRWGLGSSASMSVAASSAFLKFYTGHEFKKEEVNNCAYQIEKYFHKNPSGVDISASCFGGLIFYRKEFEFLKNISALNFKITKSLEENLYLIDSGKPEESTAKMVDLVGKMYNLKPRLYDEIFNDIEKVTKRMVVAIIKEDKKFFQQCIFDNEIFLELMGVVSEQSKNLLKNLTNFGVGKITGAGGKTSGSGYILFYSDKQKELIDYLQNQKINYYKFKQDFIGLKNES